MGTNPLKWHGGKSYLAAKIIEQFPKHTHYVEPYFGGGAVLFAKPAQWIEGHSEVVNDIDGELTNFWKVLAEPTLRDRMIEGLANTPFAESVWKASHDKPIRMDDIDWRHAMCFFIKYRMSRQGLGKDFATLSRNRTRRGMNEQVSSWWSAVEGLDEAGERLARVAILNRDALDVIRQQDGPNTLFYLDPPYLHETRTATKAYQYEMTNEDHCSLLAELLLIKGRFILSGYRSEQYDRAASIGQWRRVDIKIDNKASSKSVKDVKTECLWMNF